jgi:hypothetical protein
MEKVSILFGQMAADWPFFVIFALSLVVFGVLLTYGPKWFRPVFVASVTGLLVFNSIWALIDLFISFSWGLLLITVVNVVLAGMLANLFYDFYVKDSGIKIQIVRRRVRINRSDTLCLDKSRKRTLLFVAVVKV